MVLNIFFEEILKEMRIPYEAWIKPLTYWLLLLIAVHLVGLNFYQLAISKIELARIFNFKIWWRADL